MSRIQTICVLSARLDRSTRVELNRLCTHLGLEDGTDVRQIEQYYLDLADNSISKLFRSLLKGDVPTYHQVLVRIYKELRSYPEALGETWNRVKTLSISRASSTIEEMDELELEDKILTRYMVDFKKKKAKVVADPTYWRRIAKLIPGVSVTGAGAVTSLAVQTAARAPLAALGPGALAGPVGIALGVIMVGTKLSGPAYRKIIPATVEIMLIGRRIENLPRE